MKLHSKLICYLIILIYGALFISQSIKPFVLDEIDFPIVAKATSETGIPIYYRGEANPNLTGNYHPTLYIHSLATFIKLFGYNESTVRYFGFICTLLTAFIILRICAHLHMQNEEFYTPVFLSLFLLHPYTLANTTLPDIDSTILPVTLTLYIWYLTKKEKFNFSILNIVILSIVLAVNFWAKLTTPLILFPFTVIFLTIIHVKFTKSLKYSLLIFLTGSSLFMVSFYIYTVITNLSFSYTMSFLLSSFSKGTSNGGSIFHKIISNLNFTNSFANWITPPYILISIASIIATITALKEKKSQATLLMGLTCFFTTLFYLGLIAPFGGFFKYPFATFSLSFIPVIYVLGKVGKNSVFGQLLIFSGLCSFFYSYKFLKDVVFFPNHNLLNSRHFLMFIIVVLVVSSIIYIRKTKYIAFIFLIGISVGYSLATSLVQAKAEYPTKYYYGQKGMKNTIEYLRANTNDDEIIWSMKDVGYYVNNKYEENYPYFFNESYQAKLRDLIVSNKIRYYVTTTGIGEVRIDAYKDIAKILKTNLKNEVKFENFVIFY
jgi:hypothetical protein